MKVATRNNLLNKLSNSKWGSNASTIRTTALALSYSAAEYAYPVWARSPHASKLDAQLNDACRNVDRSPDVWGQPMSKNYTWLRGLHHLTSEDMYVLEWKRRNGKQTQPTLYTARFQQSDAYERRRKIEFMYIYRIFFNTFYDSIATWGAFFMTAKCTSAVMIPSLRMVLFHPYIYIYIL